AAELRSAIEQWAEGLRRDSRLLGLAKAGKLPSRAFALYLESLRYLFRSSQQNLACAALAARRVQHEELAEYFERKAREEHGHDRWAKRDLAALPAAVGRELQPAPAIEELVALQRSLIDRHPLLMLVYALWAEYFTVLLGDEWLDALARSGYPREQVTAIAKHLDADRQHAALGFAEVDRLWHGQPERAQLVECVQRAGCVFVRFCDEIWSEAQRAA
ncbi:MAG TPA: hypothetical protein VJR89_12240, partial [Polyangiales bacterium]|nr:hypothetical protein [Polyangiales bacterium]